MLNGTLTIEDIKDAEAYCTALAQTTKQPLNPHDQEDLIAYLIETLWQLSTRQPQPWTTSFSGYAHPLIRLRIIDWQRQRYGRTTWQFQERTHTRTNPTLTSLDDPNTRQPQPQAHGDPATDRNTDRLVRLLRNRSSNEAWHPHHNGETPTGRAA